MTTTTPTAREQRSFMTPRGALLALLLLGVLFSSAYPIRRYFAVKSSISHLQSEDRALDLRRETDGSDWPASALGLGAFPYR